MTARPYPAPPAEPDILSAGVFAVWQPRGEAAPVVFDSPHSGSHYPRDFDHACAMLELRQAEDSYVDELMAGVPGAGGTLLAALFPRSYVDVNRAVDDIDPKLMSAPWPEPIEPSDKARMGIGLVRRLCRPGVPMYSRLLSPEEVRRRLERYYHPYHAQLAELIDRTWDRFGRVWHVNCHSMPSLAGLPGGEPAWRRPDFVLGDRDGTACAPAFTAFVAEMLIGLGYTVAINDPYKGVEITRRHGRPAAGRHSLQLEINRRLYMDERSLERSPAFPRIVAQMAELARRIADYARSELTAMAAD